MHVSTQLQNLRKSLHVGVDGAWAKPEMLEAKDALSSVARQTIEACYEKCMEEGGNVKACYKECAKQAGLGDQYRSIWGKR